MVLKYDIYKSDITCCILMRYQTTNFFKYCDYMKTQFENNIFGVYSVGCLSLGTTIFLCGTGKHPDHIRTFLSYSFYNNFIYHKLVAFSETIDNKPANKELDEVIQKIYFNDNMINKNIEIITNSGYKYFKTIILKGK